VWGKGRKEKVEEDEAFNQFLVFGLRGSVPLFDPEVEERFPQNGKGRSGENATSAESSLLTETIVVASWRLLKMTRWRKTQSMDPRYRDATISKRILFIMAAKKADSQTHHNKVAAHEA